MKKSGVILEDKEIFDVNKVHKNVLRPMPRILNQKSRVFNDPSEEDPLQDVEVDQKTLELVCENITFDNQVIKSKAQYTLPYSSNLTKEVFSDRVAVEQALNDANQHRIPSARERLRRFKKKSLKSSNIRTINTERSEVDQSTMVETKQNETTFRPISYFKSISHEDLKATTESSSTKTKNMMTKSLEELNKSVFLTESVVADSEWDWDCHLINQLSENTARWMVLKKIERDVQQKEKLLALIEEKFGRFTRNVDDLDLFEDSLTEFEKQKIKEEKERFRQEKLKRKQNKTVRINKEANESSEQTQVPLYRLPQGLKHVELEKLKMPDSNFNSTARELLVVPSQVESPKNYQNQMEKVEEVTDMTLMKSENAYVNELLINNNKHVFTGNEEEIILESGPAFKKDLESKYPIQFTEWVKNIDLKQFDSPQMKKPTKGKRRWKNLPQLIITNKMNEPVDITVENNYWHLMPTTADTELRKVLGSNLTVAKIIEEWRKRWQTSARWSQAEIDELLADMNNSSAHIRFQALVICSRAFENAQQLKSKIAKYAQKTSSNIRLNDNNVEDVFSRPLFDKIISLLNDSNPKCRLAASIAIFTWFRGRPMPFLELDQSYKDKAEAVLIETLNGCNPGDKFAAALCLSKIGGIYNNKIIEVLVENYFDAKEQYTREQAVRSLAYLSDHFPIVTDEIGSYLWSKKDRVRMLTCKILPCMHTVISQKITGRLVEMMWNDINRQARKLAAQTLGRTGRGRFVHDEIHARLGSESARDRAEALRKIHQIGIMTNKLVGLFLKCFRDDYVIVRELACKACQGLNYDKNDEKIVEALVFVARFDRSTKIKALAIRTLGLVGDSRTQIRNCLLWALQFENEPLIRTEACHSLVLVVDNISDPDVIEVLVERNLIEEEPVVRKEIRDALIFFGRDPNKELPIVAKIRADIKKLNDKNLIIRRIYEMEKEEKFQIDKKLLIGNQSEEQDAQQSQENLSKKSPQLFQPKKNRLQDNIVNPMFKRTSFLSKLVSHMDEQVTVVTKASATNDASPRSSSSPSVSIDLSSHGSPELVEMISSPNRNNNNNNNNNHKIHHWDATMTTSNVNTSHGKTSLVKHIETIVEETTN